MAQPPRYRPPLVSSGPQLRLSPRPRLRSLRSPPRQFPLRPRMPDGMRRRPHSFQLRHRPGRPPLRLSSPRQSPCAPRASRAKSRGRPRLPSPKPFCGKEAEGRQCQAAGPPWRSPPQSESPPPRTTPQIEVALTSPFEVILRALPVPSVAEGRHCADSPRA